MATNYGTDLFLVINSNGTMDVDPAMLETSGLQVLVQSIVMRQFTPTGSLIGAPDECVDIRSWLSRGMTQSQVQQLGAVIQAQLLRDQRVKAAQVSAVYNTATSTLTLTENITGGQGPFTLTISVNALTVSVLLNGVPLGGSGTISPAAAPAPTSASAAAAPASTSPVAAGIPGPPGPAGAVGPAGAAGPAGVPGGNLSIVVPFGPANASSVSLVPTGNIITSVGVLVTTAFTGGSGPTVQVSVDSVVVFPAANANLAATGAYWSFPIQTNPSAAPVVVTFGGSATAGAGTVVLIYEAPQS